MSRSKNWTFTINNYTPDTETHLQTLAKEPRVTFLVYGREVAPTTGTPHLQGYIKYSDRKRLGYVNKDLGNKAHCEAAQADSYQNIRYCTKDKNFYISDEEIQEQYELTKDLKLPDHWIDREIFEFRVCYNETADMTLDDRIYYHDHYINFLLTQYPKLSRTKLIFEEDPLYDFL